MFLGKEDLSPYSYLISFSDGGCIWDIYLSDFPSVIELMNKFAKRSLDDDFSGALDRSLDGERSELTIHLQNAVNPAQILAKIVQ